KIVIVTGGAAGIGKAICEELGRRGAIIIAADINLDKVYNVVLEICSKGGRATAVHLDVSDTDAVEKFVIDTAAEYGRLDYIFNNAGINIYGEVRDMSMDDWKKIININLWGVIAGSATAFKIMVRQGHGHIINTSSVNGLIPYPTEGGYGTAKHGINGLSGILRSEGSAFNVKVSVVCPGAVKSDIDVGVPILNTEERHRRHVDGMYLFKMSTENAVLRILKGIEKNSAVIIFPFSARVTWWLHRINPAILNPLRWIMLVGFRYFRLKS
ncbi:MAG: SDR family oxidoreductase, partial [Desulfobacterales bacterium]|nr:SDR family oxidoreductase [Desulfobacterales bacterium]